jgi:hypothetical protein
MVFRFDTAASVEADITEAGIEGGLGGRVLGQLGPGEQFVIWAFRQHADDGWRPTRRLLDGFRLAFGEEVLACGLAGFTGIERCLHRGIAPTVNVYPLRCACVSRDEQRLLLGLAAAQLGDRLAHREHLRPYMAIERCAELWKHSSIFGAALARSALFLPDGRLLSLPADALPN